jgi:Uncharacterised nucleotidyltransferase
MQANGFTNDQAQGFYREAVTALQETGVPFLIGGAFALESYTGLVRRTKDLDIFVRPGDCDRLLSNLQRSGYRTELRFPHWLGKAYKDGYFIDVVFNSGNGVCKVDDRWFECAMPGDVLGQRVDIVPAEEMIWSKAFIMERDRFDGGDIAHLFRAQAKKLDWARLLSRFHRHWRVLLCHLLLFGFIYPGHRLQIPSWLMTELMRRVELEMNSLPPDPRLCQGTLLSWSQYLVHTEQGEYQDARHIPRGTLTEQETRYVANVLMREAGACDHAPAPFQQADEECGL